MAVNEFGNDTKNNIMWNREYPFIPECTNNKGIVLHEGDHVLLPIERAYLSHVRFKGTIDKIYNNEHIIVLGESEGCKLSNPRFSPSYHHISGDELELDNTSNKKYVAIPDYNQYDIFNIFEHMLDRIYHVIYGDIILDDSSLYEKQRLNDVERIKSQSR